MADLQTISPLRRRVLRTAVKCCPFIIGGSWGGFWLHCIAGLEDIYSGTALIIAAFAAGVLFRRIPGTVFAKLALWYIACAGYFSFNILWPAAFFSGSMDIPGRRGKYCGTFFTGLIVGAVLGSVFDLTFLSLLLSGTIYFLFNRCRKRLKTPLQRVMAVVFNLFVAGVFVMLVCEHPLFFKRAGQAGKDGMTRLTRLCCFGLNGKEEPSVLLISRDVTPPEMPAEYVLISKADVGSPGKVFRRKYDVIIAEHFSTAMAAGTHRLTSALEPGGVLVVPLRYCSKFPDLYWRTLPGGAGRGIYAAAVPDKNSPLLFSAETIDGNLSKQFKSDGENGNTLLAGAIAGCLTGFESSPVNLPEYKKQSADLSRWIWGIVLLLILLEVMMHNLKWTDFYCSILNALSFGVISAVCCRVDYPGGNLLMFLLIAGAFFITLPFKSVVLRIFSGISVVLLFLCGIFQIWFLAPFALFFSALTCSGAKSRYRERCRSNSVLLELISASGFAAGFFVGGAFENMAATLLLSVCSLKIWLQLRA